MTEQFDESLDRTLQALAREQVEWRSIVAERRRKAPDQVKGLEDVLEGIKEGLEWDVEAGEEGEKREEEKSGRKVDPERELRSARLSYTFIPLLILLRSPADFLNLKYSAINVGLPPRHNETIQTYKTTLSNLNEVLTVSIPSLLPAMFLSPLSTGLNHSV